MGYPMTWQRLMNRHRLAFGDYDTDGEPGRVAYAVGVEFPGNEAFLPEVDYVEVLRKHSEEQRLELVRQAMNWRSLLGDLRRLEKDAVDEGAICRYVAQETGVDADVVAAVLLSFMRF